MEDVNKYIKEIKKTLPKNMKKEKIDYIENIFNEIIKNNTEKHEKKHKKRESLKTNKIIFINNNKLNYTLFLEKVNKILDIYDIKYDFFNFSDFVKEKNNKNTFKSQPKHPDLYFFNIGKDICTCIRDNAEDIYFKDFIKKEKIDERTTSTWVFECIYIDNIHIKKIEVIIHIIQYTVNKCFLKIIPFSNITNKSFYINIENKIEKQMSNLKI